MGSSYELEEGGRTLVGGIANGSTKASTEDSTPSPNPQGKGNHRKKKQRKKGGPGETSGDEIIQIIQNASDSDIVTPYQNNSYFQLSSNIPGTRFNNHLAPNHQRLVNSISNEDLHSFSSREDEDIKITSSTSNLTGIVGVGSELLNPRSNLGFDERGAHSSLSVNNAITVAPSRNNLNDFNVFEGGRPSNLKKSNHHHYRNKKHKGRSRTPDVFLNNPTINRSRLSRQDGEASESILNRIDLSIRNKFGDWDSDEESEHVKKKLLNGVGLQKPCNKNKTSYLFPKNLVSGTSLTEEQNNGQDVNLPRLFKNYDTIVNNTNASSNKHIAQHKNHQDKSITNNRTALSKDNDDPNSILSQAKKTLSFVSGQSV